MSKSDKQVEFQFSQWTGNFPESQINKALKNHYFADFETTTAKNYEVEGKVRIYMWGLMSADGEEYYKGTTLETFLGTVGNLSKEKPVVTIWFHNLRFDFSFIEHHFLSKGVADFVALDDFAKYKWTTKGREYTTIKNGMGALYGSEWYAGPKQRVIFRDSAKLYPTTIKAMGKTVGMDKLDDDFDYTQFIPYSYRPSDSDWKYLYHDVEIARRAVVRLMKEYKQIRMTLTGYAYGTLSHYYNIRKFKEMGLETVTPEGSTLREESIEKKRMYMVNNHNKSPFEIDFPATRPGLYDRLHDAYSGGIVYVNEKYRNRVVDNVLGVDANSEYPATMLDNMFPIGKEEEFKGNYKKLPKPYRKERPLYVQRFKAKFKLKDDGFPCLSKKYSKINYTVNSSEDCYDDGIFTLCNVDMELFLKNYDVTYIRYLGGYSWKAVYAPFKDFIEDMSKKKIEAGTKDENGVMKDALMRMISKLMQNGCYGKFAQNPHMIDKQSYLDENSIVRYKDNIQDPEAQHYFPMAIFIAAYARKILVTAIRKAGVERLLYCDTDSMYLDGYEMPDIEIDPYKYGAWDVEVHASKFKVIRDKNYCYYQDGDYHKTKDGEPDTSFTIKSAGLTDDAKATIKTMDDYGLGYAYGGSLTAYQRQGGTLLMETVKYLKPDEKLQLHDDEKERHKEYMLNDK